MSDAALWTALADPHRRAIVALLLERPRPVGEIVEACGLSQPSTSKHLKVLREAGLVRVRQDAQRRVYTLDPAPIAASTSEPEAKISRLASTVTMASAAVTVTRGMAGLR